MHARVGHNWSAFGIMLAAAEAPGDYIADSCTFLLAFDTPDRKGGLPTREVIEDVLSCATNLLPPPQPAVTNNLARTTLPDRTASYAAVNEWIEKAEKLRKRKNFGLIQFNLAHLAMINERHGWDTADKILDEIVQRALEILPETSFFGYIGGGHFLVLTPAGTSTVNTKSLVGALLGLTKTPVLIEKGQFPLTLSMGWAMFPYDADTPEDLMLAARAALAESNRQGAGHDHRATPDTTSHYKAVSGLEQDLARAVTEEKLFLTWMPVVETAGQQIVGYEALLRWNRPGFGEVSPELFIECAEEAGIIAQLDGWSLKAACRAATSWDKTLRVCVNISPSWLVSEQLSRLVAETLEETALEPERLQLELSECRPFGPMPIAYRELARIRAMGVHIALDDFGRGYASLERLSRLPLDQIKLDRSFMRDVGKNSRVADVLIAVLRMAHALHITCCAKGVETEHQMSILDSYGCEEVQGYLLGVPVRDRIIPPNSLETDWPAVADNNASNI